MNQSLCHFGILIFKKSLITKIYLLYIKIKGFKKQKSVINSESKTES